MQTFHLLPRHIFSLLLTGVLFFSTIHFSYAGKEGGLIDHMAKAQYFTHKTGLALHADNFKLAKFYTHELEEVIEILEEFGDYKNMPVGKMTKTILIKEFKVLENAINAGHKKPAINAFNNLLKSCNKCHTATNHEFIKIKFNKANPFLQSFKK